MIARAVPTRPAGDGGHGAQKRTFAHPRMSIPPQIALGRLVPPISSSYSGCGKLVKELEIEKRH